MNPRLTVLGAGAVGDSVLDPASNYGHEVVAFADSSSSVVDPDGLDPSTVRDRKERKGVVGGADPKAVFDVGYDVLVEATPTTLDDAEPGSSHIEQALADGRHVVLVNRGPVAEQYADLCALEAENGGTVQSGTAVGGAIPILLIISDLGAPHVTAVRGVLNGTANFIPSRMTAEGLDYGHVLAGAQDLGVAEASPTFDVNGIDAALKFVIPVNVLSDGETEYVLDDVVVEGIRNVLRTVLDLAAEDGRTVRLIGETTADEARVTPRLIPQDSVLSVTGTQNIVQSETKHARQLSIGGREAGGPETATAVLSDVSRPE